MMTLYDKFEDNKIPMNFGFCQAFQQNEGNVAIAEAQVPAINMNLAEELPLFGQILMVFIGQRC